MGGARDNQGAVYGDKKQKIINPVWRPVSTQASVNEGLWFYSFFFRLYQHDLWYCFYHRWIICWILLFANPCLMVIEMLHGADANKLAWLWTLNDKIPISWWHISWFLNWKRFLFPLIFHSSFACQSFFSPHFLSGKTVFRFSDMT